MVSWQFLIIGTLAAVGAALALGTFAAMNTYRRTGRFPGQDEDAPAPEVTSRTITGMWIRIAIGVALALWGVATLTTSGLL